MRRIILIIASLIASATALSGQRFALSTNIPDYAMLGTINVKGEMAFSRHWSVGTAARYNPWTWHGGDMEKQMQNRQITLSGSARYWNWNTYAGWWLEGGLQYQQYSRGGVVSRDTEEGDAIGARIGLGYTALLSRHWNLEMGAAGWLGRTAFTLYDCPMCGQTSDAGEKWFALPDELLLGLVYVF
ncbi:MAG: DUF3575 domain-containing protein [Bacteroidales bacterium]|nr:DUF3575 domain-containing protein [Bacteroidales bacterium]